MNELDIGILLFAVVHLVLGIVKGFVWQMTRLMSLFLGLYLAGRLSTPFGAFLREAVYDFPGKTDAIVAYVLLFLGVFVLFAVLTHFLQGAIDKLKLKSFDRTLGGGLGVVKGFVYVFVLLLVLQWIFVPEPAESEASGRLSPTRTVSSEGDRGMLGQLKGTIEGQFQSSVLVPRIDALALYLKQLFPGSWVEKWNELIQVLERTADRIKSPDLDLGGAEAEVQS